MDRPQAWFSVALQDDLVITLPGDVLDQLHGSMLVVEPLLPNHFGEDHSGPSTPSGLNGDSVLSL